MWSIRNNYCLKQMKCMAYYNHTYSLKCMVNLLLVWIPTSSSYQDTGKEYSRRNKKGSWEELEVYLSLFYLVCLLAYHILCSCSSHDLNITIKTLINCEHPWKSLICCFNRPDYVIHSTLAGSSLFLRQVPRDTTLSSCIYRHTNKETYI